MRQKLHNGLPMATVVINYNLIIIWPYLNKLSRHSILHILSSYTRSLDVRNAACLTSLYGKQGDKLHLV